MRLLASRVAEITGGELVGPDAECVGASIDSRHISGGELFVPVKGARDGHDFIFAALSAGAAAYLTEAPPEELPAIRVQSTVVALTELGRWARSQISPPVIGITGSTGKTSTKDLLGSILNRRFACAVSTLSFNNELGVPLTLINGPDGAGAAVVEMGARAPGDIAYLCGIVSPTVGIVTNVGLSHTETLGSADGVARAKSELVQALPESGIAVLNADDSRVAAMASVCRGRVVTFGTDQGDVRAVDIDTDPELRPRFRLTTPWGDVDIRLEARGLHNVANAAAAATAALASGMSLDDVSQGLGDAEMSPWRMEVLRTAGGFLVLNDTYNANPVSTEAALLALSHVDAGRRIAILGPMLELGDHHEAEHRRIAALASHLNIELITIAAPDYGARQASSVPEVLAMIGPLTESDAVLVKASRAAGLEHLAAALAANTGESGARSQPQSARNGRSW